MRAESTRECFHICQSKHKEGCKKILHKTGQTVFNLNWVAKKQVKRFNKLMDKTFHENH